MKHQVLSLLLCSALAAPAVAQRDFSDVTIKTTHVSGTVYMLEGAGGNIGVSAGEEGILIVDDQFAGLAEKIEEALEELGSREVTYLLNTHLHGDHTGGNPHFAERHATIVAHDNVRHRLAADANFDATGLPVITYGSSAHIYFNGEEIELLHNGPGHTDGDTVVRFVEANVIHMGDLMFNGMFPYIDLGNGGDVDGYMDAVEAMLEHVQPDTKIIPGHGPLASRADLVKCLRMIRETSSIVREAVIRGDSLEQIKEAGLPEEWDGWSWGFISTERWIETLYNDATAD